MTKRFLSLGFFSLALAIGCGDDDPVTVLPDSGTERDAIVTSGESYFYVMSEIRIGELENNTGANSAMFPSVAPGFNLDNQPDNACGNVTEDHVSPPPDREEGVDNKLINVATEVKVLNSDLDLEALITDGVTSGKLVILAEIIAEDLLTGSATVKFHIGAFDGTPANTGGVLDAGQTFTIDKSLGEAQGTITNGRLSVQIPSLPVSFPAATADTGVVNLVVTSATAKFDISATALTNGFIGGQLEAAAVVDEVLKFDTGFDKETIEGVLDPIRDLNPDPANPGDCLAISAGLFVNGVNAAEF